MCKNAASGLVRLGVKKHDVIAIFSQNSPEYAVIFLAASAAGATLTTINSSYTVCEGFLNVLADTRTCLILGLSYSFFGFLAMSLLGFKARMCHRICNAQANVMYVP